MAVSVRINTGRVIVLSDLHLPFADPKAVELAAEIARDFRPSHVVLNGDVWDATPVSPFPYPARERVRLAEHVERVSAELSRVVELMGAKDLPIYYIEGNHELWWHKYIQRKAQELEGLPQLSIHSILNLPPNITYLPHIYGYATLESSVTPEVIAGALHIMHGDTIRLGAQLINVARTISTRLGVPVLVGHWHVCQEYITSLYDGSVQAAWASGALVLPRAAYNAGRIAQQGIALVNVQGVDFECDVVPFWREGRKTACYCKGKKYRV